MPYYFIRSLFRTFMKNQEGTLALAENKRCLFARFFVPL